jgi:putative heme iron utilization protein
MVNPEPAMKPQANFDPKIAAKKLMRETRSAALATLMPGSGDPYCSLVNVASAADGSPLILISKLAIHTKNVMADSRVSLMLDERKEGDPLEGARVMLMGRAVVSTSDSDRSRYLARQPEAAMFAGFTDFSIYRIEISAAHLVAGFGRIVDLKPADILVDVTGAEELLAAEESASNHMNEDHADALRLYATKLLGAPDGDWRCAGLDPEGLELQNGRVALRLPFPQRVNGAGPLRAVLVKMAEQARA